MDNFVNITKALSDRNRIKIIMMLTESELCVCQLIEMLSLAPSTVSKHMSILRHAQLVHTRKEGIWHYYSLPGKEAPKPIPETIQWLKNALADNEEINRDIKKLKRICNITKEKLCQQRKISKN